MNEWRKVLLGPNATIAKAIELLNNEGMRIALVVDSNQRLLGTITDGDVRRGLIKHIGMDWPVSKIMNTTPKTASVNTKKEEILALMKEHDLLHVPLLNNDGAVIDLETLQHLTERQQYDNPIFLMAGGFGKRLQPLTLETPKPLLKIGKKPILQTILESFVESGFKKFFISTHYKADKIQEYFGDGSNWNVSIEYLHESKPLGTAGALGLLPNDISGMPLIMMNGDLLTNINFVQLLQYHEEMGGIATMCVREYDFQVPYGVVNTNGHNITKIVEKPIHKFFVNAGIYVINQELYRRVDSDQYMDMPDLLQRGIDNKEQVNMFPIHEYWLDIGRMEDFIKAKSEL